MASYYSTMAPNRADTAGSWRRQPTTDRRGPPGLAAMPKLNNTPPVLATKPSFPNAPSLSRGRSRHNAWESEPASPTIAARNGASHNARPLAIAWAESPPGLSNTTPFANASRGSVDNAARAIDTSHRPANPNTVARPMTILAPNGRRGPVRLGQGNVTTNRAPPRIVVRDGKVHARHQPPALRAILPALYGKPMTPDDLKELWASGKPVERKPFATNWADEPLSDMPFPF